MRIEMPPVSPSLIELPKTVEKSEVAPISSNKSESSEEESQSFNAVSIGSSRVYSPASLRAAVDYHAKFLTVADNNIKAATHSSTIPQALIDRLNGRLNGR